MPLSQLLNSSPQELNAELGLILNAIVEGICGLDTGGKAMFCNDALLKMIGYRADELIGRNLHELLHNPPDRTKHSEKECALRNALDYHQATHVTAELLWRKDGTSFPAEYWVHPLPQPSGLIAYVVTLQDLTEIKQAQDVVRQSEEKFRRILGSIPDVAWTSDRHGRTIYISPKVEAVFGYTKQEICLCAERWLGRIHPEDFGRVNQAYCALFENQSALDEEYRIRRKDGTWIWVHDRATGTRKENGVLCADGMLSDITRRKRAELELQSKTALLEAQANSTVDGILVVDGRGQRLMHNRRLGELFHIPPDKLADKNDRNMLRYVVTLLKDPDSFLAKVNHFYKHPDETSRDEIEFKDGTILDRYSSPVIDTNGIYYGRIWTFRDITERKRNQDTLHQLSTAVEQSPVSVVITDPQGDISYVNLKFTESTGYSPEEVLGKNSRFLKSGRCSPDLYRDLWSTITQGREWHGEFCNRKKNGEIFWEATTIRPITDSAGAITHFLAIKEDITERRRAEKELRLTQFSVEHASDAVHWVDAEGRIVFVNQASCLAVGRSREELLSMSISQVNPLFPREAWRTFWEQLKTQGSMTFESKHVSKQGHLFPVEVTANYLEFDGQEYCFAFGRDISERKRAETDLRLTQFAIEHASDAIFRLNPESRILYVNAKACRSAERSRDELLALSIPDIAPLFPKETWLAFWNEIKTRGSMTLETVEKTKNGRVFPVEVTANYLQLEGQEYVFSFVRDITDRNALESQLRQAQKLEGIGQLAAGIAHEINTPTQFVTDNLTFLRDSWKAAGELLDLYRTAIHNAAAALPPDVVATLEQAERNCDLEFIVAEMPRAIDQSLDGVRRVAKIVRAMKEFSHPDSAEKTTTDLSRAIESTITVAGSEWKHVAEIVTDFDETLPPIVCYPGDINQVILNLLVNAAHSIKETVAQGELGRITIRTRKRGEYAEVSVSDTGAGIPEAIRNRVFDPFFTTKPVGKGTGQGLSLAHAVVVQKHAGKIWFETEMGFGTTFFLDLPISTVDSAKEN